MDTTIRATPTADHSGPTRVAVIHTAIGRVGGAERQLLRFSLGALAAGEDLDVYYSGPTFPELTLLGARLTLLPSAQPRATLRAYLDLLKRLRTYPRIIVYHHVEPVLLGLVVGLHGPRCVEYLGEPLRPLWEGEITRDTSLVSYPEMGRSVNQLYGRFGVPLLTHSRVMGVLAGLLRRWDRWSHQKVGTLLTVSRFISGVCQRVYRLPSPPGVVYQGIHGQGMVESAPSYPKVVLNVAAFIPIKNHRTLIDAWRLVEQRADGDSPELVLIGDGPLRPELQEKSHAMGLKHLRFVSQVSESEMDSWYRRAFVLVHPAIGEAFGMTPVEAAACQVPSIVSDDGGTAEFVEQGSSGVIVPARDARQLAAAILGLLQNPGERDRLGQGAYLRQSRGFTLERNVAGLLSATSRQAESGRKAPGISSLAGNV